MLFKIWIIFTIVNLIIFYRVRNEAIEAIKTDPRTADKCKDMTDEQIGKILSVLMLLTALSGPVFWLYILFNAIKS